MSVGAQDTGPMGSNVSGRWKKEEMALKHMQTELQQQHAVLAKEVQDLKETLEVRIWLGAGDLAGVRLLPEGTELRFETGLGKASVPRSLTFPT